MTEFFFENWPHGVGPATIQLGMLVLGATAGIRLIDDGKRALASLRARRVRG